MILEYGGTTVFLRVKVVLLVYGRTSFDCRMLRRGIHSVPTIVSQINPLFHISTVRPRSRRFISLERKKKISNYSFEDSHKCMVECYILRQLTFI